MFNSIFDELKEVKYFKGNAQFVQNTTFGLYKKNDSSMKKNVL